MPMPPRLARIPPMVKRSRGLQAMTLAASAWLLASCANAPEGALTTADAKAGCEALKGHEVAASRIVWPGLTSGAAVVDSATFMPASALAVAERGPTPAATITPAMPAHCRLVGRIAPVDARAEAIQFQVNLPLEWNGRSVQFGGGGFNGVLITGLGLVPGARYDTPSPLAQGYATVGTDSGHQNKPGQSPMAFALNDEMLTNFAHAAYPKVRNVSVELMRRAYGREPAKLYFVGSSEGGREGITMAQRYPGAFNGIFARVPVIHWTGLQFAGARNGAATFGEGWLGPAQVKLVHEAVLNACDAADGATDRIVASTETCRRSFDVATLMCPGGAAPGAAAPTTAGIAQGATQSAGAGAAGATATCLSAAQVRAVQTLRSPYRFPFALANGLVEYPAWGIGGEDTPASGPTGGWRAWWTGSAPPAVPPVPANGIAWVYGAGALQYFFARDPKADPRQISPEAVAPRVREVSALMDATSPDLGGFHARGGKLIILEYLSDYAQSPYAGLQYGEAVRRHMGPGRANEFFRVYAAPGVDHVGTGAPALVDMLGVLRNWVERQEAPIGLQLAEQEAKPPFAVLRTRPLCEWPRWPRFKGGDAKAAASFECVN